MAELLGKDWKSLIETVEKGADKDVTKEHCGKLVSFFLTDVVFSKPSLCDVSGEKVLAHEKCPTDLKLQAGVQRIMGALGTSFKLKKAKDEMALQADLQQSQQQHQLASSAGQAL